MKKILLFLLSFCALTTYAQKFVAKQVQEFRRSQVEFTPISILTQDASINSQDLSKALYEFTTAKINLATVNYVANSNLNYIELSIPYKNQIIKLDLYKVEVLTEDFRLDTDKEKNIPYQKGKYYRGVIKGDYESIAVFNFFNGECNGIFSNETLGNVVVGKIVKPNNSLDYVVFQDNSFKVPNSFECHTKDDEHEEHEHNNPSEKMVSTNKCATFYFEIDHNLYLQNGSNTTTTSNWMTSVYNNVQTLFTNDGITTGLKSLLIWTIQDPYEGIGTSSSAYLQAFRQNTPVFNGDVGMLVGIDPGGLGGVAYRDSICFNYNHAYSDVNFSYSSVPTYSWTVQVITHEFGHSLGSRHTHACSWNGNNTAIDGCGQQAGYSEGNCAQGPIPSTTQKGTIMSYCHLISGVGISFSNGFGTQPAQFMTNTVNAKSCLSANCVDTCINTVANINVTNITETSAYITWTDVEPTVSQWQISVTPMDSFTFNWVNRSTTNYTVNGLLPNTYYKVRVRPVCQNLVPKNKDQIFATNGNTCANLPFTDTGGVANNHSNLEDFTRTFTPTLPNQVITVTFTEFSLENNYDFLYVYNGPNTTFPEFNGGLGYTGTNSPGTVTSTAANGSLTFRFVSDQYVTDTGWVATVSCTQQLNVNSNAYLDFTYYPNPTRDAVTLKANSTISKVEIFNIEGRRLYSKPIESMESTIDISQFASGTYFFKARIGEIEKNFKIVKL